MLTMVTGATGFVGNHLVTALLERGDQVRALVRDPARASALAERGVELVAGDITDEAALGRAVAGVECVYHSAALAGDWMDPDEARRINVGGTRNLLVASTRAGVRRVVHVSSLSVLGNRHHHGSDESTPYKYAGDPYTDTKIDSERLVLDFARQGDVEAVALRPGFIYGPGDRQVFPRLLQTLATGEFRFVGDGSKQMNLIYVADVVQATLLADRNPQASGQAYNLTDGANTPIREFIGAVAEHLQIPPPTRSVPPAVAIAGAAVLERFARLTRAKTAPRLNTARLRFLYYNQHYSIEKARRELGYAPRYTYREGLPPTIAWFRQVDLLPKQLQTAASPAG